MLSREEWEALKAKKSTQPLSREEFDRAKRMAALDQSKANIAADEKSYSAAGDTVGQRLREGIGAGMVGVWDRVGNLALPKSLEKGSRYSEEAIAERKRLEGDLMETGAGQAGKFIGEIAATAPVGMAARGIAAGGQGLLGASRLASTLPTTGAGGLVAGMAGRAAPAALEGAAQSAILSDPGELGKEAAIGAGLGGVMGAAGKLVGATARKLRPSITEDARDLMAKTGQFIPASQALPEGSLSRQVQEGLMANLPGSGGAIRGQRKAAVDAVRSELVESAIPKNASGTSPTAAVFQAGDKMSDVMPRLQKEWDTAYDNIYKETIPGVRIPQEVADLIKSRAGTSIKTGGDLTGREALDLAQGIQQLINEMPKGRLERAARSQMEAVKASVEKQIEQGLPTDLSAQFTSNKELYKNFLALKDAAKKAVGSEFSLRQAERSLAKKGGSARELAQQGVDVLKEFPSRQGLYQMIAASTVPAAAGGFLGWTSADSDASLGEKLLRAGSFGAASLGGARLLSTPAGQKMLYQYGDEGLLDKYAKGLRRAGQIGRAGVITAQEE